MEGPRIENKDDEPTKEIINKNFKTDRYIKDF